MIVGKPKLVMLIELDFPKPKTTKNSSIPIFTLVLTGI